MVRAIALMGLAILFLAISDSLRHSVWVGITALVGGLEQYSPFSYVALVIAIIIGFLFFLRAASVQR
jgi:uncharacterized membrane protein (DUF106 family)